MALVNLARNGQFYVPYLLTVMGVVERVFRTENVGGVVCNNILYIVLNVVRLKELTFPPDKNNPPQVPGNFRIGVPKSNHRCPEISGEGMAKFQDTNTEITTKTTPENTPSIYPAPTAKFSTNAEVSTDGLSDEELQEEVEDDLYPDNQIPYSYSSDKRKMEAAIKIVTEWKSATTRQTFFKDDFDRFAYELLVDCLTEMACETELRTYKGSAVSSAKVLDKINDCCKKDGSLEEFARETVNDYIKAANETEIHDKRKYM